MYKLFVMTLLMIICSPYILLRAAYLILVFIVVMLGQLLGVKYAE